MKTTFWTVLTGAALMTSCAGESTESKPVEPAVTNVEPSQPPVPAAYDSVLATQLGADEYGMRKYVMVILQQGTNPGIDTATKAQVQRAHLKRLKQLGDEGKLLLVGPFLDDGFDRGIMVLNTTSIDTARMWTSTDPAVKLGQLQMELHEWYGSAALVQLNGIHKSIQKSSIVE